MKTYEEEYNELVAWCEQSLKEADIKIEQLPKVGGYNDAAAPIRHEVWQEWNKKLIQLKVKYNRHLSPQEEKMKKS